jgi:futalosine hydrolase
MNSIPGKRILVVTAVSAEQDAVLRGLQDTDDIDVCVAGVGSIAAAANTSKILAAHQYDLVVSAGIGGGFVGKAGVGSIVVASEIIAADLGAETPEGFLSLDELGFGTTRIPIDLELASRLSTVMLASGLQVNNGAVLTVSTVTGTAATADELVQRVPNATAEAMEGYGVAYAAQVFRVPVLELRTISNLVGPRDRSAWRIGDALQSLEQASSILKEALL